MKHLRLQLFEECVLNVLPKDTTRRKGRDSNLGPYNLKTVALPTDLLTGPTELTIKLGF